MKPSMFCEKCEVWTKDYAENGNHSCGNEVQTSTHDSGFPDLDYEGSKVSDHKV